jgi:hypothetical protein
MGIDKDKFLTSINDYFGGMLVKAGKWEWGSLAFDG